MRTQIVLWGVAFVLAAFVAAACLLLARRAREAAELAPAPPVAPAAPSAPEQPPIPDANFAVRDFLGDNVLLLSYSYKSPDLPIVLRVLRQVRRRLGTIPLRIFGLTQDRDDKAGAARWNREHGVDFPVYWQAFMFRDDARVIKERHSAEDRMLVTYFVDRQGKVLLTQAGLIGSTAEEREERYRCMLFHLLGIRDLSNREPIFGFRPLAPDFEAETTSGARLRLSSLRGQPVLLVFVTPDCPWCQKELAFLRDSLYPEVSGRAQVWVHTKEPLDRRANYPFRISLDPGSARQELFATLSVGVPDTYLIDAAGRIALHWTGFVEGNTDALLRTELRRELGLPAPPLLPAEGYAGARHCASCHAPESHQWQLTRHADAFASLQRIGKEADPECVKCHVTGLGEKGGYDPKERPALADVQCEACHGPAARHPYKGATREATRQACLACHDDRHSIAFSFEERVKYVTHAGAPDLSRKTWEEREQFLEEYHRRRGDLFAGLGARYVGAESCRECHQAEFTAWQKDPHGRAAPDPKQPEAAHRFVTGFQRPGGYPERPLVGVQCEACHGPGENHVKDPKRKGTTIPLRGQCDRCVAEPICLTCHGGAAESKWDFEKALPRAGHGPAQKEPAGGGGGAERK